VTRHVTVTASAAATRQAESGGRMVAGGGRGDAAVGRIGPPPARPAADVRFARDVMPRV
jgi:hypothetical protein